MKNNKLKGTLLIILSTFAYGIIPIISQLAFKEGLNVSSILFFRFFIATIITWSYIFFRKIYYKTTKAHFFYLVILGVFGFLGTSSFIYMAYTYISGSLATIILFTHPAMIACYEIFFLKKEKDIRKILALLFAFMGIIFVVGSKDIHLNMTGVVFSLFAAVCYSFYALGLAEKRTKKMNSIVISGYIAFSCCLTYFIQGIIRHNIFLPTTLSGWGYIIILAIFSTVFATIAFCKGVQLIGPSTSVIISTFEPVVACIAGFFVLGETLTIPIIIGGVLILSAIFILQMPEKISNIFYIKRKQVP
ncbi:DMT family transporter [Crassaminicella thermophila]|uniref:DMT family transporter n=1 Tax=Crassaminicella thermophila TaxID=2599308 RepID=A0A5C0SA79_CRATE|nr:DMT family transporter [Crassaminicella thermophila]QEK11051.1 DMT family transporter [Crassaminicella thermophila]